MGDYEPRSSGKKWCIHCHQEKSVLAFAADKNHSDGLRSWCRECDAVKRHEAWLKIKESGAMKLHTYLPVVPE